MREPNLLVYDQTNVKRIVANDTAYLRINPKGALTFSQMASEVLELTSGCKIAFANDKNSPQDWYVRKDENGLKCRLYNNKIFGFSSAYLRKKILKSLPDATDSLILPLGSEPIDMPDGNKWFALITKKINGKKTD